MRAHAIEDRLTKELESHTPDGRRPTPTLLRQERWLPVIVVLIVGVMLATLLLTAGWLAFVIGFGLALFAYAIGAAPLWGTVLMREREHNDIEDKVQEIRRDADFVPGRDDRIG
jgi:hypothetical protein